MNKVSRDAWKPGAVWTAESDRGTLEAIILAPSRTQHKEVFMTYLTGRYANRPIRQEYSHRHMTRYFKPTGEVRDVTALLNCEHEFPALNSHCTKCGASERTFK